MICHRNLRKFVCTISGHDGAVEAHPEAKDGVGVNVKNAYLVKNGA